MEEGEGVDWQRLMQRGGGRNDIVDPMLSPSNTPPIRETKNGGKYSKRKRMMEKRKEVEVDTSKNQGRGTKRSNPTTIISAATKRRCSKCRHLL